MGKIQKHIAIVRSDVPGLSSLSRVSAAAIQKVLAQHYSHVQIHHINNQAELDWLKDLRPDLVFLGMKFLPKQVHRGKTEPNKLWIADYLDDNAIRYTGSPGAAAKFDQDKSLAKSCIQRSGLRTSHFFVTNPQSIPGASAMPFEYPVFIKPPRMGGGQGIDKHSVAHSYEEFSAKVTSIAENHHAESLVEKYLTGREFSVALLVSEQTGEVHAMPIELVSPANERGDHMLSSVVKSGNLETVHAVTDASLRSDICRLALDAFVALGGRDYGRIDIRLNKDGEPQFLEANLIPSVIDGYGSFPKACQLNVSLGYEAMILQIVRLGFAHDIIEQTTSPVPDEDTKERKPLLRVPTFSLS